jgi:hypothetical protein
MCVRSVSGGFLIVKWMFLERVITERRRESDSYDYLQLYAEFQYPFQVFNSSISFVFNYFLLEEFQLTNRLISYDNNTVKDRIFALCELAL